MKTIQSALLLFLVFTLLLGGLYPAVVTGCAQLFFPRQAAGSIIADQNGRAIGSKLIGQPFSARNYFWPRPSATSGHSYNPLASGGSNLGPTNPALLARVRQARRPLVLAGPVEILSEAVLAVTWTARPSPEVRTTWQLSTRPPWPTVTAAVLNESPSSSIVQSRMAPLPTDTAPSEPVRRVNPVIEPPASVIWAAQVLPRVSTTTSSEAVLITGTALFRTKGRYG